jgi:hypothetical protein
MHPQMIFQISWDRHRENLARVEQWRLARPAGVRSGGSYPRRPLTRLARWARGVAGRHAGRAGVASPHLASPRPAGVRRMDQGSSPSGFWPSAIMRRIRGRCAPRTRGAAAAGPRAPRRTVLFQRAERVMSDG